MVTGDRAMRTTFGLDDTQLMLARDAGDERGGTTGHQIGPFSESGCGLGFGTVEKDNHSIPTEALPTTTSFPRIRLPAKIGTLISFLLASTNVFSLPPLKKQQPRRRPKMPRKANGSST